MKLLIAVTLLAVAGFAAAECPDACNGHGFCGEYDKCSCWRNWMGNSCADRVCPYDLAYVDLPNGDMNMDGENTAAQVTMGANVNERVKFETWPTSLGDAVSNGFWDQSNDGHFYAECSNKGMCDRKSGLCSCFDGFEGTACRRTVCPNDCSGHGTCETMEELATAGGNAYTLWDRYKMQVCNCDPQYFGIDCSLLHCPYGDDPLTTNQENEVQWFEVAANDAVGGTFRITYEDEYGEVWDTMPIQAANYDWTTNANNVKLGDAIKSALKGIPNSVFEDVSVQVTPLQYPLPGFLTLASDSITWGAGAANDLIIGNEDDFLGTSAIASYHLTDCGDAASGSKVAFTSDAAASGAFDTGDASNFASHCYAQINAFRAKITFTTNPGDINDLGCTATALTGAAVSCSSTDTPVLPAGACGFDSGDAIANIDLADLGLSVGDQVSCGNTVVTIDGATAGPASAEAQGTAVIATTPSDAAITGLAAPALALPLWGTSELVECSHRGLCNHGEGLCECFNGYTLDDCGAQDALSA